MRRLLFFFTLIGIVFFRAYDLSADYVPESVQATYRNTIIAKAETYLGVPYQNGGSSHVNIDCSGLTMNVYSEAGVVTLSHDANSQKNQLSSYTTTTKSKGKLFFNVNSSGYATHTGICASSSQKIHAASGTGVTYASYTNANNLILRAASWLY